MKKVLATTAVLAVIGLAMPAMAQCCSSKQKNKAVNAEKVAKKDCSTSCTKTKASKGCDPALCDAAGKSAKLAKASSCDKKASCADRAGNCFYGVAHCGPRMDYLVAGERIHCPKNATLLAKAHDAEIRYAVGDDVYADKNEALDSLATRLEQRLEQMTQVRFVVGDDCVRCPMQAKDLANKADCTVKYRVASYTFDNKEDAEKAAQHARKAADKIQWKMVVGGKEMHCAKSAEKAASSGKTCSYKVGEHTTPCKNTARVELAQARIEAAREAAAELNGSPQAAQANASDSGA